MTALPPKKKLVKSTALAKTQSTLVRLNNLLPTTTTVLSPTTVYQAGPGEGIGNQLDAPTTALPNIGGWYGSWTAPDLNNGQPYQVQVECFGPGGGGGGGVATQGGGGGGGGEYACEPTYTVSPGVAYTYQVGVPGTPGCNNSSALLAQQGTAGSQTVFDLAGLGIPGGVVANPGQPGDIGSTGIGGTGGAGSINTVACAGGAGGTNQSGNGSDNPLSLAQTSGMFVGNTLSTSIIQAWYIMNDGPDNTFEFNDSSTYHNTATATVSSNGILINQSGAPSQVPAYTTSAKPPNQPNATTAGDCSWWRGNNNSKYAGYAQAPGFGFGGSKATISCWIYCDQTSTWGNNAAGSIATIAANSLDYATGGTFNGYGLYLANKGSLSSPNWYLYFSVGDNSSAAIRTPLAPILGGWYYVVATFNSGTMTLYVQGAQVATGSAGFSSIPGGLYDTRIGTNPASTSNYFFGYISNIWFSTDCATSTLVTQAYSGVTSATGGAGGGASGSAGGIGSTGVAGSGITGGAGGTAIALPSNYSAIRTPGSNGVSGANAAAGRGSASASIGAGGGGSGDMASSPASYTLTIPFSTAATYCGTDSSSPGALYNASQQTSNSTIITGGVATDTLSGSKNTLALLPKGIASSLGSGKWTIQQITLTFTNAATSNVDTILEFAYTGDTTLPANYTGADAIEYVGDALIEAGASTVTFDLTQSKLGTYIQNGTCTALCFGPNDNPTFDAYNATTGAQFYCQIYGPGATDAFGNSLAPYLTIVLQETLTTQTGSKGGEGAIIITQLVNATTPVSMVQPFDGADDSGNAYSTGFTAYPEAGSAYSLQYAGANSPGGMQGGGSAGLAQLVSGTTTDTDTAATLLLSSANNASGTPTADLNGFLTAYGGTFTTTQVNFAAGFTTVAATFSTGAVNFEEGFTVSAGDAVFDGNADFYDTTTIHAAGSFICSAPAVDTTFVGFTCSTGGVSFLEGFTCTNGTVNFGGAALTVSSIVFTTGSATFDEGFTVAAGEVNMGSSSEVVLGNNVASFTTTGSCTIGGNLTINGTLGVTRSCTFEAGFTVPNGVNAVLGNQVSGFTVGNGTGTTNFNDDVIFNSGVSFTAFPLPNFPGGFALILPQSAPANLGTSFPFAVYPCNSGATSASQIVNGGLGSNPGVNAWANNVNIALEAIINWCNNTNALLGAAYVW